MSEIKEVQERLRKRAKSFKERYQTAIDKLRMDPSYFQWLEDYLAAGVRWKAYERAVNALNHCENLEDLKKHLENQVLKQALYYHRSTSRCSNLWDLLEKSAQAELLEDLS